MIARKNCAHCDPRKLAPLCYFQEQNGRIIVLILLGRNVFAESLQFQKCNGSHPHQWLSCSAHPFKRRGCKGNETRLVTYMGDNFLSTADTTKAKL